MYKANDVIFIHRCYCFKNRHVEASAFPEHHALHVLLRNVWQCIKGAKG